MVAYWQKPVWLVMACAAFVAQVVPEARGGHCDRGCCVAQETDCSDAAIVSPLTTALAVPAAAEAACPVCAAPSGGRLAHADESPCHCQLDARQDQPLSVNGGSSPQRDNLPVWGDVADSTSLEATRGLAARQTYLVASRSIPIRPVRIIYGVWRN